MDSFFFTYRNIKCHIFLYANKVVVKLYFLGNYVNLTADMSRI